VLNNDGGAVLVTSTNPVPAGWHVLGGTYSSPNGAVYVDGALAGTGNVASTFTTATDQVGGLRNLQFFQGDIGRVLIWGRVLKADELAYVFGGLKSIWSIP
jgi:hypothetical protein